MRYAKEIGCPTISVTMNPNSEMAKVADYPISVVVGPEVLMGSTRMKAGTAQKMVLNMLTTGAMVKLGKVYSNLMVDVKASNEKLVARAKRIVMLAADVDENTAAKYLNETNYDVKLSIFMIISKLNKDKAKEILNKNDGYIQKALDNLDKENK
jgi:N-acetylmuramic acid 6-phosphate etherase